MHLNVEKTFQGELSGHFQQIRHLGSMRYQGKLNGQVMKRFQRVQQEQGIFPKMTAVCRRASGQQKGVKDTMGGGKLA